MTQWPFGMANFYLFIFFFVRGIFIWLLGSLSGHFLGSFMDIMMIDKFSRLIIFFKGGFFFFFLLILESQEPG